MQMRLKVSKREATQLIQFYDAFTRAKADAANAEGNLLAAASMILARRKISQALVDGVEGDELILTVPDAPEELKDADRTPSGSDAK